MRKNSRNNAKKERAIMIASSAFVLTALTMTGIYMKSNNENHMDDGYTIDLTELENNVEDKIQEIAQNETDNPMLAGDAAVEDDLGDDLDYPPMEVGSGLVELPGLNEGQEDVTGNLPITEEGYEPVADNSPMMEDAAASGGPLPDEPAVENMPILEDVKLPEEADLTGAETQQEGQGEQSAQEGESREEQDSQAEKPENAAEGGGAPARILHYAESEGLLRPVSGEVLIPYSMDSSVYFTTLAQYKYNSALMLVAQEDTPVTACAEGRVISIFENEEIGHAVTMELGDGYQITYGQLKNITVSLNEYVDAGQMFAQVAAPTKYFCVEGSNLYLRLTAGGNPVNPEALFR